MKKVTILIQDKALVFKYRTNKPVAVNLLNTNIITNNELVFSDEYIAQNKKIVGLFISDLIKEKNINEVVISSNEMAELMLSVLKCVDNIELLTLKDDTNLSYSLCEKIIRYKNIKKINCYAIPTFMIELLDKHNIKVESRNEILFTSSFMQNNHLDSLSDIYYKSNVRFTQNISKVDIEDFKVFCTYNKYLKYVHIDKYSKENIVTISKALMDIRKKNISIEIHEDVNDIDEIEMLRDLNKNLSKYKLKLNLVYSKDYLEKNYGKQMIYSTLKTCSIIIFAIILIVVGGIFINNKLAEKEVNEITSNLKDLISEENNQPSIEEGTPPTDTEGTVIINNYQNLLDVNSDTVGWLKVIGTNIDYPVVQTTDNSYYLNRNYYTEKDSNGWVFMDYRNNPKELHKNTIIYAHNRYYSGVMFGTLNNVLKWKWYSNEANHYITFNTLYENIEWKVFSIYSIDVTTDYLLTKFSSPEKYQEFLNLISNRSDIKLKAKATVDDQILTLSTCLNNNRRLVVHAVRVNKNES